MQVPLKSEHDDIFRHCPGILQTRQVQESDGNFFESFSALAWKQQNKRLRAVGEVDKCSDELLPNEIQYGNGPKQSKLSREEFELLYIEVLYTVKHKVGQTAGCHSPYQEDLFQYAMEAFRVGYDDHNRLLDRASEEKPPIVILNAAVIEASGLEAKDADGFSDPYCMLGIMPNSGTSNAGDSQDVDVGSVPSSDEDNGQAGCSPTPKEERTGKEKKKRFSIYRKKSRRQSKVSVRDALPARLIKTTLVKHNTLNPVWKEKFRFDLDNVCNDMLHLDICYTYMDDVSAEEIGVDVVKLPQTPEHDLRSARAVLGRDHDDEISVVEAARKLNEVSGLKGLSRFFKQVAQSARTKNNSSSNVDDFLGCINVSLEDVPSTGIDKWYQLVGRTSRSNIQGEIHLKLGLATREDRGIPEDDNWSDVRQHEDLMCIFIEHEVQRHDEMTYTWTGDLPQVARTILHQHAIQGDITEVQQAVCRWMAYSRKHMQYPLKYNVLFGLLDDLNRLWEPESLSREEEESLAVSFLNFIAYSLSLLRKHRDIYPVINPAALGRMDEMLRCLSTIYKSPVFKQCCPFQKRLHSEILAITKKSTAEYYDSLYSSTRSEWKKEEDNVQSLINLVNQINAEVYRVFHSYNDMFKQWTDVDYYSIVYNFFEKQLSDESKREIEAIMREYNWINEPSPDWCIHDTTPVNTSLFDLYLSLQEFYKHGQHLTDREQEKLRVVNNYSEWFQPALLAWLRTATLKAEERVRKAIELEKVAHATSDIKYSTSAVDVCCCFVQLFCIFSNFVVKKISEFWKQLSWPEAVNGFNFVYRIIEIMVHCASLYADLMHTKLVNKGYYDEDGQYDVKEEVCITINNIEQVRRSLRQATVDLEMNEQQLSKNVSIAMDSNYTDTSLYMLLKHADESMNEKISFVINRVADNMRQYIKRDVFHLNWAPESLPAEEAIGDLLEYLDGHLLTLNNYLLKENFDRILTAIWIETLEEFSEVIDTEEVRTAVFYQRMFDAINLLEDFFHPNKKGLDMNDIFTEKLQNSTTSSEYGILSFRVIYRFESRVLSVEVLNAKDLIPLDANGLSDPYVLVSLCPKHVFPDTTVESTKIMKKTLNPVFDECFEFEVFPSQLKHQGAMLAFTVMDHDVVFQNDFGGEALFSLAAVPGISGEDMSGFEALNVVDLPLMHPITTSEGPVNILKKREWDVEAQEFVKERVKIEELAKSFTKLH